MSKPVRTALIKFWEAWQDVLKTIHILDPACGSGAFLIEAFDQLHVAYQQANGRLYDLRGPRELFDLNKRILENNLYGVDLNEEAIEICRLSLWIKTAERGKALTSLDHSIRVGNSIVADPSVDPRAFNWREAFPEVFSKGGFDVVVANPPYVRQELLSAIKPYLESIYASYHGMADLYVYFYELGIRLLRPGGLLSFIVTNKWMKSGYGEPLRKFFAEEAWIESVVDFGHAKQIFEEADVFPSIIVARKPTKAPKPTKARLCTIPREQLRIDDLSRQIDSEGVELPLEQLGADAWQLEPGGVNALLDKIRSSSVPLQTYCGTRPFRGVTTGLNEAFLIDEIKRQELLTADPNSAEVLRPYLRGQDLTRWSPDWAGLWMIFARRGMTLEKYPAVERHLSKYRTQLEPRPPEIKNSDWPGRRPGTYEWYELQDPVEYWEEFLKPKIIFPEITWRPQWSIDRAGMFSNNTVYFVPRDDMWVLAVANSPACWWYSWRTAIHGKDEALRFIGDFVQNLPIPRATQFQLDAASLRVLKLTEVAHEQHHMRRIILDWLRIEHEIEKASLKLQALTNLDSDAFVTEVKRIRGTKNPLSVAALKSLRDEHARSIEPARQQAAVALQLERQIGDLVNQAYGFTPEEAALMWQTAPPRMPYTAS